MRLSQTVRVPRAIYYPTYKQFGSFIHVVNKREHENERLVLLLRSFLLKKIFSLFMIELEGEEKRHFENKIMAIKLNLLFGTSFHIFRFYFFFV